MSLSDEMLTSGRGLKHILARGPGVLDLLSTPLPCTVRDNDPRTSFFALLAVSDPTGYFFLPGVLWDALSNAMLTHLVTFWWEFKHLSFA